MDQFETLTGAVSGSDVVLRWTSFGSIGPVTAVAIQRSSFGSEDWATIGTASTSLPGTYTDSAPEAGEYAYRLAVTVTQGGIDNAGTLLYSNNVNVTNLAATSAVTLTGSTATSKSSVGYTTVSLSWTVDNSGVNDDVIQSEVQRSTDSGAHWRHAGTQGQFVGLGNFSEDLQTGLGPVQYRVVVSLPPKVQDSLQTPFLSTSNVLTVTL